MLKPNIYNVFNSRIRAGALYYALFISVIGSIAMLLGLTSFELQSRKMLSIQTEQNLEDVLHSGLNIYSCNPALLKAKDSIELFPFENLPDYSCTLVRKPWGVFDLIYATARCRSRQISKNLMFGEAQTRNRDFCLYVPDKNDYLLIGGNSMLIGNTYLPALGIKQTRSEYHDVGSNSIISGKRLKSERNMPALDPMLRMNISFFQSDEILNSSNVDMYHYPIPGSSATNNSFLSNPVVFYSDNTVYLSDQVFSGNIIIKSNKEIVVEDNFSSKDIILVAPKVIFANEYNGNLQVFASDTILIGDNCIFTYPSAIVLNSGTNNSPLIQLGKNTVIHGGLILNSEININKARLYIGENSVVNGIVYSNSFVEHRGTIYGTMYLREFEYHDSKAYYKKHIINASINKRKLDSSFVGFAVGSTQKKEAIKNLW